MKASFSLTVVFLAVAATVSSTAAEPRPITAADLWKVKRVGPPSVSPDGLWCVVDVTTWNLDKDESSSSLWLLSTDGKTQTQLTFTPGKNTGPRWAPDGKLIAFTSQRTGDDTPQIYVIAPTGGEARRVTDMPMAPSGLKWSADSRTIYAIAWTWPGVADDEAHRAREKSLKEAKSKAVVIDDTEYRVWDKWISDGKRPLIFAIDVASGRHRNLLAKSKRFLPPSEPPPSAGDYDVSPDGKELCFVSDSAKDFGTDFNSDLYTVSLDDHGESGAAPGTLPRITRPAIPTPFIAPTVRTSLTCARRSSTSVPTASDCLFATGNRAPPKSLPPASVAPARTCAGPTPGGSRSKPKTAVPTASTS